jgi:hypothetical protein
MAPAAGLALGLGLTACADDDDLAYRERDRDVELVEIERDEPAYGEREDRYGQDDPRYGQNDPRYGQDDPRMPSTAADPGVGQRPLEPDVAAAPPAGAPRTAGGAGALAASGRSDMDVGFEDHRSGVQAVAVDLEDLTLLVPSTLVITEGNSLRIRNDSARDQRLRIPGLEVDQALPKDRETTVALSGRDLPGGAIYSVELSAGSADENPSGSAPGPAAGSPLSDREHSGTAMPGAPARPGAPDVASGMAGDDVDQIAGTLLILPGRAVQGTATRPSARLGGGE